MFRMTVEDTFQIKGRGLVATGRVESGAVRVGDTITVDDARTATVDGVEMFRKVVDEATTGDNVGLLFRGLTGEDIARGAVLTGPGMGTASSTAASLAPDQLDAMRDAGLVEDRKPLLKRLFGR